MSSIPRRVLLGASLVCSFLVSQFIYGQQTSFPAPFRGVRVEVGSKTAPDEILVRYKQGVSDSAMQAQHARIGTTQLHASKIVPGLSHIRLNPGVRLESALQQYRSDANVLYAEPNYVVHALGVPNDPYFPLQWNFDNTGQWSGTPGADIGALQAWGISTGSSTVYVGVIDSGVDYSHPDLAANIWKASNAYAVTTSYGTVVNCPAGSRGFNMVFQTCDPMDDEGHGTHVSGTIGAIGNNGVGVAGVNWHVQIIPCKFLDANGGGYEWDAIACLEWFHSLKLSGVPIIATNNSYGGGGVSQAMADAIATQDSDGTLFVAAAGNNFEDNDVETVSPAGIFSSNLISVAATTNRDTLAAFSDIGAHSVHLGAPGQEIVSTYPGKSYASMSGTSMAAPHVTGLAALLKAANPSLDWKAIRNLILTGGDPIPALSKTVSGRRLNAYGSLTCSGQRIRKRLQPTLNLTAATVGEPVNLAVMNITCGSPAGTVQMTVQPGGQIIVLKDDGVAPDQTKGDGIYSGRFIPSAVNSYSLSFPGGETLQVEVLKPYTSVAQTTYRYRTITGTSLNLRDDSVGTISAPFPVHFGGSTFNKIYVSSNGTLSFTNRFDDFVPERIPVDYWGMVNAMNGPAPSVYQPVVTLFAPWWQDLAPIPNTAHNVFWAVNGTAPNRELVIEWRDVPPIECAKDLSSTIRFQVVLSESSDRLVSNYADAQFGGSCSASNYALNAEIGVQVSQTQGLEWAMGTSYAQGSEIPDGTALLWTATAADNPRPTITSLSKSAFKAGSPDTWVTVNGTGFVPSSEVEVYAYNNRPTKYVSSTQLEFMLTAEDLAYPFEINYVNVFNPPPVGGYSPWTTAAKYTVFAPLAQITSVSPSAAPQGSFALPITVNGSGFVAGEDLIFDNGKYQYLLQVTERTSTQLSTIIPDDALQNAVTAYLYIKYPNQTSNKIPFTISAPTSGIPIPTTHQPPVSTITPPPPPFYPKFRGWKEASRRGSDFLKYFMRPRAGMAPKIDPLPIAGLPPTTATANSASLPLPGFGFRPSLPADFLPTAVVTGDFNGDGHQDWAVANGGSDNVWIYLGKGDGTSSVPTLVQLRGSAPVALAAADMNGDGKLDLVVAEADSLGVAVLFGNGDGTFQTERLTYVPGAPLSIAVADFNRDGHPDVVVGLVGGVEGTALAFLAGDGTGNLANPTFHFDSSWRNETIYVASADLNGDGLPDLVVAQLSLAIDGVNLFTQFPSVGAKVYLNIGNGNFKFLQIADPDATSDQIGYFGHSVMSIALGDVNHDGCVDLVTVDHMGLADYLPGLCNGTFDRANMRTFGTGVPGAAAALRDVNGDGKLDLIVSGFHFNDNYESGTSAGDAISIVLGNGNGSFAPPTLYRGESSMFGLALADLNGDGKPEIITANQGSDSATVFQNDGKGAFGSPGGAYIGYQSSDLVHGALNSPRTNFAFTDVDGDGNKDLLFFEWPQRSYQPWNLAVMRGDGHGHYGAPVRSDIFHTYEEFPDFVVGDFRKTGHPDILAIEYSEIANIAWSIAELENNGDGTFQKATYPITGTAGIWPIAVAAGDFNRDGKLDGLVLSSSTGISLIPLIGAGDGTFKAGTHYPLPNNSRVQNLTVGDFNHDGKLDVLLLENGALYLIPGHGDGTFAAQRRLFAKFGPFTVTDLNGDGIPDLVEVVMDPTSTTPLPLQLAIYLGQSTGGFVAAGTYGPYPGLFTRDYLTGTLTDPTQLNRPMVADFNGDGHPDISVFWTSIGAQGTYYGFETGPGNTAMSFLLGKGDGTFTPTYTGYDLERYFIPQIAADTNGDGKADLIQMDAITSSYHVVPAVAGPSFQIGFVSDPIVHGAGAARITLALPAASDTIFKMTVSDSRITIPSSVTVPAGSVQVDVPVTIATTFNPLHVIAVKAQLGTESHTAYGTERRNGQGLGFAAAVYNSTFVVLASQTTPDYELLVGSLGGYSSELSLKCQGLPAGATCNFQFNPLKLAPGATAVSTLTVSTDASVPIGTYPFTINISDANYSYQVPATLGVGDFGISGPSSQTLLSNGLSGLAFNVDAINGYRGDVTIACNAGLPAALQPCPYQNSKPFAGEQMFIWITTKDVPPGTYHWTVTGTVGTIKRQATLTLQVVSSSSPGSGGVGPTQATIHVGSANFKVP
jgi:hypothetical protein